MLTQFGCDSLKTSNLEQGFLCQQNRCILDILVIAEKLISFRLILKDLRFLLSFSFPKETISFTKLMLGSVYLCSYVCGSSFTLSAQEAALKSTVSDFK